MSTSNSSNYSVTRADIIKKALQIMGVLGEGESPNTNQTNDMSVMLNMLTKAWQADGLNLFAVQDLYLFPKKNQRKYTLSNTTTDHFTTTYGSATLAADAASGQAVVELSSDLNLVVSDYIGVATSGTDVFWTLVSSVSGTTVTLADNLPETAEEGNAVFAYRGKANRPMKLLDCYVRAGNIDTPVQILARKDYNDLSLKGTDGRVNQIYFDPQRTQAFVSVWPETNDETDFLVLTVQRTLDDMDSSTDEPDYPQEWFLPLTYNLAWLSCDEYGVPQMDRNSIEKKAAYFYEMAYGFDREGETSIQFRPHEDYG